MALFRLLPLLAILLNSSLAVFREDPTVFVTLLVRNKAHVLPYFLRQFEEQDYPKNRIILWIKSDGNTDASPEIMRKWIESVGKSYHHVYHDIAPSPPEETNASIETSWSEERFRHVINLKEESLNKARELWADYIWFLDCDILLTNNQTLKSMVKLNYPVVAPMLDSVGMYSNYWCGMGDDFYYKRTEEYKPIREREKKGCYQVMLVHSCFLVDLRQNEALRLTFLPELIRGYTGPHDDIITFSISGYWNDVSMHVCNDQKYGYILVPTESTQTIEDEHSQLTNVLLEASVDSPPVVPHNLLTEYIVPAPKDKLGFDEVFLINLKRRPERRERMEWALNLQGIEHKLIDAVDGKTLNDSYVQSLGIRMLPNFADPYHHRAMTMGEIGCFLSHYHIWQEIVDRQLERSVIFEDDLRFEFDFRKKAQYLMEEADNLKIDWDLIYLGRKRLRHENETWVSGSQYVVNIEYSYWTLSYVLSRRGAEKLIRGEAFSKLVPVDEYLPIMYDKHPEARWKEKFSPRNLKAFSVSPLLIYPTHYTGEKGYISDTEASPIVPETIRMSNTDESAADITAATSSSSGDKEASVMKAAKGTKEDIEEVKLDSEEFSRTGEATKEVPIVEIAAAQIEEIVREPSTEGHNEL